MPSHWHAVLIRCRYDPALAPIFLALVRVAVCLYPQHGYVHPDEFFQSTDIVAGRHLNVKHDPSWEFTTEKPIRSMFMPLIINYGVLKLVRIFVSRPSPYLLLVAPRLAYTLLSFIVDLSLYKICKYYSRRGLWYLPLSVILQTSFASLVLFTRTLSNTLETIIFSILLMIVCRTIRSDLIDTYQESAARTRPFRPNVITYDLFITPILGFLIAFGTSIRPTFMVFAIVPMLYWLYYEWLEVQCSINKLIRYRLVTLAIVALLTTLTLSVFDTIYYKSYGFIAEALELLYDGQFKKLYGHLINKWVLTTLNFVIFNTNSENLEQFTIHSPLTHMLVNIPLLFNVLAYVFYAKMSILISGRYGIFRTIYNMNRIHSMMMMTIIVATALLSFIPHQEFRFLLPLIVPFVFAFAFKVYSSSRHLLLWLLINSSLLYFYGNIHQSGITRALFDLHKVIHIKDHGVSNHLINEDAKIDIIAARCYLVPAYILDIPANSSQINLYLSNANQEFNITILRAFERIMIDINDNNNKHDTYIMLPSTYRERLYQLSTNYNYIVNTKSFTIFSPYFTGEDLESSIEYLLERGLDHWTEAFGFDLIHVELNQTTTRFDTF